MTPREFLKTADTADLSDPKEFQNLVAEGMKLAGITVKEAARKLKTAPGTVSRWMNGHSAPHVLGRAPVIKFFQERIGVPVVVIFAYLMVIMQISCGYSDSLRPIPTGEEESEVTPDTVIVPIKAFRVIRTGAESVNITGECEEGTVVTVICPEGDNPIVYTLDDCGHLDPVYLDDSDYEGVCGED